MRQKTPPGRIPWRAHTEWTGGLGLGATVRTPRGRPAVQGRRRRAGPKPVRFGC
jgi:hypothetical protein